MKKLALVPIAFSLFALNAEANNATVYGRLDLGLEYFNNGQIKQTRVESYSSRLGFRGEEKLDNGLSAIWQIETRINTDDASASNLASRDSYVGLKGEFGTLILGRADTPFKAVKKNIDIIWGNGDQFEPFVNGARGLRNFHTRQDNVVQWWSPKFNGVTLKAAYAPDEARTATTRKDRWSFSGEYEQGPLHIGSAYEIRRDEVSADANAQAWKLIGSYKLGDTTLGLAYSAIENEGKTDTEQKTWSFTAQQQFDARWSGKLALARSKETRHGAADGGRIVSLQTDYALSKRSSAYLVLSRIDNEAKAKFTFTGSPTALAKDSSGKDVLGLDPRVISLGLRHNF